MTCCSAHGRLDLGGTHIPYKVLGKYPSGVHLQFDDQGKPREFEQVIARLTTGAPIRKAG